MHYAKNCLGYMAPIGLLGHIRTEKRGGPKTINLKECIRPLETFARIYAIKHGISAPETLERLQQLHQADVLDNSSFRETAYIFDYLWRLRFFNQIEAHAELSLDSDDFNIESLTDVERDNLQSVLSRIPVLQTKLSYDFLGVAAP